MLYQILNGTVSVGGNTILDHIDFEIREKEKIAIVGANGTGKTTLLRLISGELELDRDDKRNTPGVKTSRNVTVGMLRQSNTADASKTIEEILLEGCPERDSFSKERFAYEMEYDRLFTGFGFEKSDKKKLFMEFSGGEQTKIGLIRLLLEKPDILLLDEPTNHLDIETMEWLEDYMKIYPNAVVFVSHDRFFLDQVVTAVYELDRKKLRRYAGNYTQYRQQKAKDIKQQTKAYERQKAELKRLNELIEKFKHKPSKASFARSRKSIIERMELIEKPEAEAGSFFTGAIEPEVLGPKWVYEAEHLKIGYNGRVIKELSLKLRRGQKIGIIGANGTGKTTFLKTVAGELPAVDGKGSLGNNVLLAYYDQQTASIQSEDTVLKHFHDLYPAMTEKEVRNTLGMYLFSRQDAAKKVSNLSGGEKARLMLAELITGRPNLMVLDEPTNHMDIKAKETLESAFKAYTGTMLFVSHDRYFISQLADAILVFEADRVMYYPFGYEHYLNHCRRDDGEDISALMEAENQALVAGLRAVPKPERHRLKEINTEEAYIDWRLRLAAEPMEAAREEVDRQLLIWDEEKLEEAVDNWTYECLKWYDVYLSLTTAAD
ncbi:MAG: ABC-F family ATP-binding cassette domain-containing protein [Lachnobacterium sp.]|nr:ABC-F family ATP-binding cassette domain-containing protein [Lachnobacterium sp.]